MLASSFPRTSVGGFFVQPWASYIFIARGYVFSPILHIYSDTSNPTPSLDRRLSNTQKDTLKKKMAPPFSVLQYVIYQ